MALDHLPLVLCLLLILVVLAVVVWYVLSMSHYSWNLLKPGDVYMAAGRRHTMPNVDTYGPTYLLKDQYIGEIRTLVSKVGATLKKMNIEWWVTGGTLLGYEMYDTIPMPFDDDADIAVEDKWRPLLFSKAFVAEAAKEDLRVLYLRGASSKTADRTGACVRCQLKNCTSTLDIFFWQISADNQHVVKLDGWQNGVDVPNEKEQFLLSDVFPIQNNVAFDGLVIGLPACPRNLLTTQYSAKVFDRTIARSLFVSHTSPFVLLQAIWTNSPPG